METYPLELLPTSSRFKFENLGSHLHELSRDIYAANFESLSYLRELDALFICVLAYVNTIDSNTNTIRKIITYSIRDVRELVTQIRTDIRLIAANTILETSLPQTISVKKLSQDIFRLSELIKSLEKYIN